MKNFVFSFPFIGFCDKNLDFYVVLLRVQVQTKCVSALLPVFLSIEDLDLSTIMFWIKKRGEKNTTSLRCLFVDLAQANQTMSDFPCHKKKVTDQFSHINGNCQYYREINAIFDYDDKHQVCQCFKKKTVPVHFVIRVTQNVDVAGI